MSINICEDINNIWQLEKQLCIKPVKDQCVEELANNLAFNRDQVIQNAIISTGCTEDIKKLTDRLSVIENNFGLILIKFDDKPLMELYPPYLEQVTTFESVCMRGTFQYRILWGKDKDE